LIDGHFSFVAFVYFVFKMGFPLKTVEPNFFNGNIAARNKLSFEIFHTK